MAASLRSATVAQAAQAKASRPSLRTTPVRKVCKVVCSAQKESSTSQVAPALAAAALAVVVGFGDVQPAAADIAGLTPCSESKQFQKRLKGEVKTLTKRLAKYDPDSAPALALRTTIERTEKRFANYAKAGLLCGNDGYPHLISDPGLALRYGHAGETLIPTVGFLYVAGWIGYVGRKYLNIVRTEKKPQDKEIIIDVPLAISTAFSGFGWPLQVVQELRNGSLTEKQSNITVSPR